MSGKEGQPITAQDVADYFLANVDSAAGDNISNLKLQKLLYYAQGLHLAIHGKPLFSDEIKAWQYGPVVVDVYHRYKNYGAGEIPAPENFDPSIFGEDVTDVLDEVSTVYGQFSALRLMQMTHQEPPWSSTDTNAVIPIASMENYFRTQLIDGQG